MKDTERFKLSEFNKIIEEDEIPGNFTSVLGGYFIPGINKIGYYKSNGCMLGAENDADLRELLATKILETIGMPHADVVPVYDEEHKQNGCMSINILKDSEVFVNTESEQKKIECTKDFIESDISEISKISNISNNELKSRRKYVAQYLYASALISNTDIKMDNRQIIYNKKSGMYRNAEYYDAGIAFLSNQDRYFFQGKDSNEILNELYKDYASEIFPLAVQTEQNLTKNKFNEIMSDKIYDGFDDKVKSDIITSLNNRVDLIKRCNHNIIDYGVANPIKIDVKDIKDKTRDTDVSLKDKAAKFILNLKNRIVEKEKSNDNNR